MTKRVKWLIDWGNFKKEQIAELPDTFVESLLKSGFVIILDEKVEVEIIEKIEDIPNVIEQQEKKNEILLIPKRLQQEGIHFVLITPHQKTPFQKEWQKKDIQYNNYELLLHLHNGGNYGVIGGGTKKLLILDFDDEIVQNELMPQLPETFSVKTGSGKFHLYFYSDRCESYKILDEKMNTIADVQGEGKQVIGANSIHPNGKKYEVFKDIDIAFIHYGELKAYLEPYNKQKKVIQQKTNQEFQGNGFTEKLKSRVSVQDVLNSFGIDTSKKQTQCPFHDSKGGKCFGFEKEYWHCFHCDKKGTIFNLVMEHKNLNYPKALEYLAELGGLSKELEEDKKIYIENKRLEGMNHEKENAVILRDYVRIDDNNKSAKSEFLVKYIKTKLKIYTIKDDLKSEVWVYKDGIYVPNGICEIQILLRDLLIDEYSNNMVSKVIEKISAETYINQEDFFGICYIDEIPVSNGILNIKTRQLNPYTQDKVFFNKMPVKYNPFVSCPMINKFLEEVLANKDDKKVFYEIGGFGLLKDYRFEKAFMFVGAGRNGKGKSQELIKKVVGSINCSNISLFSLKPESFSVALLFGKLFNIAGDLSSKDLDETGTFKQLTGRDTISAKRKFLRDLQFVNHAKMIFACNNLPRVKDYSFGFWNRWKLLEFPYTFVTEEEYTQADDKTNFKIQDPNIIDKITTEDEISGLLNEFLDGLDRLFTQKDFSSSMGTESIKNTWIRRSDSFTAFCMDCIEENPQSYIVKSNLRKIYSDYCRKHNVKCKNDRAILETLHELFGVSEERKIVRYGNDLYGEQEYVWVGIKIK